MMENTQNRIRSPNNQRPFPLLHDGTTASHGARDSRQKVRTVVWRNARYGSLGLDRIVNNYVRIVRCYAMATVSISSFKI